MVKAELFGLGCHVRLFWFQESEFPNGPGLTSWPIYDNFPVSNTCCDYLAGFVPHLPPPNCSTDFNDFLKENSRASRRGGG